MARTFVSLLLNLELLRQILLIFPLYIRPNCSIIHEISGIANLLAIHVSLLEHVILEIFVCRKLKDEFEPRLGFTGGEVLDTQVGDVFERAGVTISDQFRQTDVIPQCGEPELGYSPRNGRCRNGKWVLVCVVLGGLCSASLELFCGGLRGGMNKCTSARIERFSEFEIL